MHVLVSITGKIKVKVVGECELGAAPWIASFVHQWVLESSDAQMLDERVLKWLKISLYCQLALNITQDGGEISRTSALFKVYKFFPKPLLMDEVACITPRQNYLLDGSDTFGLECHVEGSLILQLWRARQYRLLIRGGYVPDPSLVDLQLLGTKIARPRLNQGDILELIASQGPEEGTDASASMVGPPHKN